MSAVVILKIPVQVRDIDHALIADMIEAANTAGKGEFASTGELFPSEQRSRKTKDADGKIIGKVEFDGGREDASKMAQKFVRAMDSRSDREYRSRTWQTEDGSWTFGVAAKNGEAADENSEVTPDAAA